jgi:Lrp/AsnC family transcriptional regulator for asnA, asnC and gidA
MRPDNLDVLDQRIIGILSIDGRRPYRDIGRELGVSEGTIRQRVSRLTESGLIRITAVGNLFALGFDVVAMLHIKAPPHLIDSCASAIAEYPFVRFVTITFGAADIIAQSLHASMESLHSFVRNELPARLPDITSVEIFPQVQTLKSSWSWETWFELQQDKRSADALQHGAMIDALHS